MYEGARIFDPRHTRNRQMIRVESDALHYKPITEHSEFKLYFAPTVLYGVYSVRYSYPWVRGALSTESRISVKRRSIQDFPGLGPLCDIKGRLNILDE